VDSEKIQFILDQVNQRYERALWVHKVYPESNQYAYDFKQAQREYDTILALLEAIGWEDREDAELV